MRVEGWSVVYPFPTSPHMRARVIREIGRILHHPPPLHPRGLQGVALRPARRLRACSKACVRTPAKACSGVGAKRGRMALPSERVHPRVWGNNSSTRRPADRAKVRSCRARIGVACR
jgi:hypothetical protein